MNAPVNAARHFPTGGTHPSNTIRWEIPMTTQTAAPWNSPPERTKTLRQRRAEKLARRAERWGQRLEAARAEGADMVAAVTFDRLRAGLDSLPAGARDRAYEAATEALDRVREMHAE